MNALALPWEKAMNAFCQRRPSTVYGRADPFSGLKKD
jgi:hypothetical protein